MKLFKIIGLIALLLALAVFIFAKLNHVSPLSITDKTSYNSYSGIAIKGYDPVAYFMEGPKEGMEEFNTTWKETVWYFASKENLALFQSNPDKYSPQFGGYCSFAITTGYTATIDPTAYTIQDEKLYLFNGEDLKINFMMNTKKSIKTAATNWEK